jgi:hypothetical protein
VFGFLRHRSFQARNAFAPIEDPPFTRAQYGLTLGGPFARGRTFFFFAFEQRKRQESGFFTSDVSQGLSGSATIPVIPGLNPIARTFNNITPAQASFINTLVASGNPTAICGARAYGFFASSGGTTALTGGNPLLSPNDGSMCPAISPITPGMIGPRFILSGAPVPLGTTNAAGQFIAFRPLNNLQRVFPITDDTTFNSFRLDHLITQAHQFTFRFGYNPSEITGIQVESQNQSLGQNDFSRTGIQTLRDYSAVATLNSTFSNRLVNEARFCARQIIIRSATRSTRGWTGRGAWIMILPSCSGGSFAAHSRGWVVGWNWCRRRRSGRTWSSPRTRVWCRAAAPC